MAEPATEESDLYASVLKTAEARLLLALAAANGAKVIKTDTKQAYLYCDIPSPRTVTCFVDYFNKLE